MNRWLLSTTLGLTGLLVFGLGVFVGAVWLRPAGPGQPDQPAGVAVPPAPEPSPPPPAPAADPSTPTPVGPPREQIEADLKLVATGPSTPLPLGARLSLALKLVNTSKTATYQVVWSGERQLSYTATLTRHDGTTVELERRLLAGCGLRGFAQEKDVELKPGDELPLGSDDPSIPLEEAGRIAVRAHYQYWAAGPGSPQMSWEPTFRLTSAPVEVALVPQLHVRVRAKGPLKAGGLYRNADVLEVTVTRPGEVDIPDTYRPTKDRAGLVFFQVEGDGVVQYPVPGYPQSGRVNLFGLRPGEAAELFAGRLMTDEANGWWKALTPGTARAARQFTPGSSQTEYLWFWSDWVDVRVEP